MDYCRSQSVDESRNTRVYRRVGPGSICPEAASIPWRNGEHSPLDTITPIWRQRYLSFDFARFAARLRSDRQPGPLPFPDGFTAQGFRYEFPYNDDLHDQMMHGVPESYVASTIPRMHRRESQPECLMPRFRLLDACIKANGLLHTLMFYASASNAST